MTKLIVVEGPDQVGKATQVALLSNTLRKVGNSVAQVEVPFKDGATHPLIYWMLRNGTAKKNPNLFQFVQFLNKFVFQVFFLFPLMLVSDYVVLDRWSISSLVYGDATGVNQTFNRFLFWFLIKADCTFVIQGKTYKRNDEQDAYEKDSKLQADVKEGYARVAEENSGDHFLISNEGSKQEVHERILLVLADVKRNEK